MATLEIMPGSYLIEVNNTDPSDPNATDFNSFFQSQDTQINIIDDESNNIHIILANERMFSGQLEIQKLNFAELTILVV